MIVVGQVIVEERDGEKALSRAALSTCAAQETKLDARFCWDGYSTRLNARPRPLAACEARCPVFRYGPPQAACGMAVKAFFRGACG
jgi:hypothetical protein